MAGGAWWELQGRTAHGVKGRGFEVRAPACCGLSSLRIMVEHEPRRWATLDTLMSDAAPVYLRGLWLLLEMGPGSRPSWASCSRSSTAAFGARGTYSGL